MTAAGHRRQEPDRRGHRPRVAARAAGQGRGLPRGLPGRPARRRPLQRAHRVRPGPVGAGRCRRRAAARPDDRARRLARRGHQPRPASWARRSAPTGATRSCSTPATPPWSGFGDWAEQLIAESTGKQGRGLLPVVVGPDAPEVAEPGRRRARDPHRTAGRPSSAPASPAASARSSSPGSTPSPSPAGCSASTPSTSRTSRAPRRPAAACSTSSPEPEQPRVRRRRDRGLRLRRAARRRERPWPRPCEALLGAVPERGYLAVMAYLDRVRDAALAEVRNAAGRQARPAGHLRLGPAVPALHRPAPQGRPADRRLPADHRQRQGRPRHPRPPVQLRHADRRPGGRRRRGARRQGTPGAALRHHPARAASASCAEPWRDRPRLDPTRCGIPGTAGCRASPSRAPWWSSASPATWPARS